MTTRTEVRKQLTSLAESGNVIAIVAVKLCDGLAEASIRKGWEL
jgi:hypothetical protein